MDLFSRIDNSVWYDARANGTYPYFHRLESRQGSVVTMEGRRTIMLGSNNYLGLTTHPAVIEAAAKALEKYGTGCSGSRFLNGTLDLHIELEEEIAGFIGKESAVCFSTGFQTNLGILAGLLDRKDYVVCDRENHASIYDGCRLSYATMLRYRHSDMEDLERQLQKIPDSAGILIVTDGIFSMSGDIAKLDEMVPIARKYGARIMVDDAHALGVIGEGGRGTASHFGLDDDIDIVMGTFSKSLASLGGYMAAPRDVCEYVRHRSRPYLFSASITPASAAAALAALRVLKADPGITARLAEISEFMRSGLRERGIAIVESVTPIIPIYTYDWTKTLLISGQLFEEGVYLNPVIPPAAPDGKCMLRTSYMATHTREVLGEALEILDRNLKRFDIR